MTPPIPAHQKAGLYVFKQKADLIYGHVSKCIRIILFIIFLSKHCCSYAWIRNVIWYILDVIMNNDGHGQWNETGILLALHQRSFFLLSWLVSITPSWLWCHWGSPSESASPWSAVTNQTSLLWFDFILYNGMFFTMYGYYYKESVTICGNSNVINNLLIRDAHLTFTLIHIVFDFMYNIYIDSFRIWFYWKQLVT